ncbi:MAG: L-threonylcarbamoyladenylate synthase [Pseudomonadota bacterium]
MNTVAILKAVQLLKEGKLVAIPTETVYGLAADASNPKAVEKIFKAKGRPSNHPLIVHIADSASLATWAIHIPDIAYQLAEAFWPGPLTMVLNKAPSVPSIVTGGQNTVAIRSPNHPITQQILKLFKGGLAAPSANRFGHISPTTAEHVKKDLGKQVDLIIDGGPCIIGVESTIVDLTSTPIRILRPGAISAKQISNVIHKPVIYHKTTQKTQAPRVSGSLSSHYAPNTPAIRIHTRALEKKIKETRNKGKTCAVLARKKISAVSHPQLIVMPKDPENYARILYQQLRFADLLKVDLIIVEDVPQTPKWRAVQDRLNRATKKT